MLSYPDWKRTVLGTVVGSGQCVALADNYASWLFPGVSWTISLGSVGGAQELFDKANPLYFQKIANDTSNAAQLPQAGDIMVFSHTPYPGYTNTFNNPYGHTGLCDSASNAGYDLLQQNAPNEGEAVNVTFSPWRFRHCIGWLRPIEQAPPPQPITAPAPAPAPAPSAPQPSPSTFKEVVPPPTPPPPAEPAPAAPPVLIEPPAPVSPVPPTQTPPETNTPIKQDNARTFVNTPTKTPLNKSRSSNWGLSLRNFIKQLFLKLFGN